MLEKIKPSIDDCTKTLPSLDWDHIFCFQKSKGPVLVQIILPIYTSNEIAIP